MILEIVLVPSLSKLSTPSAQEFVVVVFPRLARFHDFASTLAVVFGASLAYVITGGDVSILFPTNPFGLRISVGALLGLTAFLLGSLVIIPSVRKVAKLTKNIKDSNREQSMKEISKIVSRIRIIGPAGMVILFVALVFMVGAGFY